MSKELNKWAKEIHQNAVDHGWWFEDRPFDEITDLFHSELSEALEEFRNGMGLKTIYANYDGAKIGYSSEYTKDAKPEGIPVELADCVIRILDYSGRKNIDIEFLVATTFSADKYPYVESFGKFIAKAHSYISKAFDADDINDESSRNIYLANCICLIYLFCKRNSIDLDAVIEIKHEYNITRPYRHGGKAI